MSKTFVLHFNTDKKSADMDYCNMASIHEPKGAVVNATEKTVETDICKYKFLVRDQITEKDLKGLKINAWTCRGFRPNADEEALLESIKIKPIRKSGK